MDGVARYQEEEVNLNKKLPFKTFDGSKNSDFIQRATAFSQSKLTTEEMALIPDKLEKFEPWIILKNRDTDKRKEGILEPEKTVVFFGRRGSGKTFSMRWVLQDPIVRASYPRVIVMTESKLNGFWQQYVPDDYIYEGFRSDVIYKIIAKQTGMIKNLNRLEPEYRKHWNPNLLLILDDVISGDDNIKYSRPLDKIFTLGRHLKIGIYISSQYAKGVNTVARGNIDLAVIYQQTQYLQKESITRDFLGNFSNPRIANEILDKFTSSERTGTEHSAIAIDLSENSTDLSKILYQVHAEEDNGSKLGDEVFQSGS